MNLATSKIHAFCDFIPHFFRISDDTSERNDENMKHKFNLQLLADGGGASTGASTSEGTGESSGAVTGGMRDVPGSQGEEDLSNIEFGVSMQSQEVAQPEAKGENTTKTPTEAELQHTFDEMIKKGGQWHDQFDKRTQDILNKRFKETKKLEKTLESHNEILGVLAAKYGLDASDSEGILKAVNEDDSLFESAAFEQGLTTEQYRNKLKLEQENKALKAAQEEAARNTNAEQIYAGWLKDADAVSKKYGVEIDLAAEIENPDFTNLLSNGISFEAAFKTVHFDDIVNGAMATTASQVEKAIVNNITSRQARPAENGTQSASGKIFKSDASQLTDAELDECIRRVARGAQISFG